VGPTPGRTRRNPSSPGDVPGFGGGGGSFAWTYNNLQPQLSASMAAGAGAAGLTAGAAALVSTLGLDIGLTASAAGPVGAVVGALTELGFLFADLFGGGPDIPRELRLPAHSLLGMETVAGEVDVVDQAASFQAHSDKHYPLSAGYMATYIYAPTVIGIGPAVTFATVPSLNLRCLGFGGGLAFGHNFSAGPIVVPTEKAPSILSGWSLSWGYNTTIWKGVQASGNYSGTTGGWSFGSVGVSLSLTYSFCF
jgi:hypothetical protein